MSFNRLGLILIGCGLIYFIGSISRQMRLDREAEDTEHDRQVAEKQELERRTTAQREKAEQAKRQQDREKLAQDNAKLEQVREKLEQGRMLAEKLAQERLAVERWEAAAAFARQSQPEVQVQTMIEPKNMVLVSAGKKKNRLSPKNAKTLVQQVRGQLGEGASVKIIDAAGREIARSE